MRVQKLLASIALSVCMAVSISIAASAQGVSAVTLQVVPTQTGQQGVVTPRGMVVPLPGAGVNGNSVQIYMGQQGGYWYIDRNGQTVDLTAYVQQMKAMSGQAASEVPQYAPPPPVQQQSSGGSAMGTAAAAGLGAMAGAAMTGAYYNNVPYGTPVYYPSGRPPYYVNAGGNTVNVTNQQNYEANAAYFNHHTNNVEQQQQWYNSHKQQNSDQFKRWQQTTDNPFVSRADNGAAAGGRFGRRGQDGAENGGIFGRQNSDGNTDGGGRFGRRFGGGDNSSGGGGVFGRRGDANADAGNRFGNTNQTPDGGGRFGRRSEGANSAGGRFGGAADDQGGGLRRRGR